MGVTLFPHQNVKHAVKLGHHKTSPNFKNPYGRKGKRVV